MRLVPGLLCCLLLPCACNSPSEGPQGTDGAAAAGPDAAMPFRLEASVFGNGLSFTRGWLRHLERCSSGDAGCATSVVALIFSTTSTCPDQTDADYRSVEVYLTRWEPGTYVVGSADPVTVKFVLREGYYRQERIAVSGRVVLNECDLAAGRCLGTIDAASSEGDRALGPLQADLLCAAP